MTTRTGRLDADIRTAVTDTLSQIYAEHRSPAAVAQALRALGWSELLSADEVGATRLLMTQQGRALGQSSALQDTMLRALGPDLHEVTDRLVLLLPPLGSDAARPGADATGAILLTPLEPAADLFVAIPTSTAGGSALAIVPGEQVVPHLRPAAQFDHDSTWQVLLAPPATSGSELVPVPHWTDAVAAGRLALAAEIIGVSRAAFALAVEHTSSRRQYGRAIGSFQAVRHRLAESFVAIESAEAVLEVATEGSGSTADPSTDPMNAPQAWLAAVAKARAGRAQADVMRTAVQVLGAMGLTQESTMHRYVTRAAALDALLGGYLVLERTIGAALLSGEPAYAVAGLEGS